MSHKRNRRKGRRKGIIIFLILILATVVLICTGIVSKVKEKINQTIYPLYYEDHIVSLCEEYDFDPAYICAVIYTESKFESDAESHAGAKGLMQLMPETFADMASRRGENVSPDDITDPCTNIEYGIYYLRHLADTYGFENIYTLSAAYNAGPGAVSGWLQNSDCSDDGKTLKSIPFKETSDYVNKIKKAEEMYQSLYFD